MRAGEPECWACRYYFSLDQPDEVEEHREMLETAHQVGQEEQDRLWDEGMQAEEACRRNPYDARALEHRDDIDAAHVRLAPMLWHRRTRHLPC